MAKIRTGLSLEPWVVDTLSSIAERNGFYLAAPHAAHSGRQWDYSATVTFLVETYGADRVQAVIDALDRAFGDVGGCRLRGDTLEIGDRKVEL
jgi:hypothetical protein